MLRKHRLGGVAFIVLLSLASAECHSGLFASRPKSAEQQETRSADNPVRDREKNGFTPTEQEDLGKWHLEATLLGHRSTVQAVVFSHDGSRLFSGSAFDGQIKVWNVAPPREVESVIAHSRANPLRALAISPDGKVLASASMGPASEVKLWDARSLKLIRSFPSPTPIYCLTFSRDSKRVFAAGEHEVFIWNLGEKDKKVERKLDVDTIPIFDMALSPDGKLLYTAGNPHVGRFFAKSGVVRAWDPGTGSKLGEVEFPHSADGLDLSRDGSELAVAAVALHLFDVTSNDDGVSFKERFSKLETKQKNGITVFQEQFMQPDLNPVYPLVAGAAASPGKLVPDAGHVSLFDNSGKRVSVLQTERPPKAVATTGQYDIKTVVFSPNGELLAMGGEEGKITLWSREVDDPEEGSVRDEFGRDATSRIDERNPRLPAHASSKVEMRPLPTDASNASRELWKLERDYRVAEQTFLRILQESKNQKAEARRTILEKAVPKPGKYASRLLKIARDAPDDDAAFDALAFGLFLCRKPRTDRSRKMRVEIIEELSSVHFSDSELSRVFYMLERLPSDESEQLLKRAGKSHPEESVRAHACFSLARYYHHWAEGCRISRRNEGLKEQALQFLGTQLVKKYQAADPDELDRKAERHYRRVINEYADVVRRPETYSRLNESQLQALQNSTIGELAKQQLQSLRQFSVGKKAPEVQGEDIDGVQFKLSDYRGRVVVLVFSANWCGTCRRMREHERMLLAKFKEQPFTLLHVNSDYNRKEVKRLQGTGELTWRCFWDGPGPKGPIATEWNIDSWPEVYVLDRQGVIRYREVRGQALSVAVERLLSDLKSNRPDDS